MRKTIFLALMLLMVTHSLPAVFGAESVASRITAMPTGTSVELRLKNRQTLRGTRGPVSNSGFTLVDARTGEHQIPFDDVASVKQLTKESHLTRNILIGVGVGVAAVGITAGILLRCGSFGCH